MIVLNKREIKRKLERQQQPHTHTSISYSSKVLWASMFVARSKLGPGKSRRVSRQSADENTVRRQVT